MAGIKVIEKREDFIVIFKEAGLPSAPLLEGDDSALTQALKLYPQIAEVKGKKVVEMGLLHRIDTDTEGLLVIALSQDFYDYLISVQNDGQFIKNYKAVCRKNSKPYTDEDAYPPLPIEAIRKLSIFDDKMKVSLSSCFRPFGKGNKEVRPVTSESGRAARSKAGDTVYTTEIQLTKGLNGEYEAFCTISKGYRHQVRSHLAWLGFPIAGDSLYSAYKDCEFKFTACGIRFPLKNGEEFYCSLN